MNSSDEELCRTVPIAVPLLDRDGDVEVPDDLDVDVANEVVKLSRFLHTMFIEVEAVLVIAGSLHKKETFKILIIIK